MMSESEYNEIIRTLIDLVERSEKRIDKTNDMISKCVGLIDKVTSEYTSQLSKLQEVRDEVVKQNTALLKAIDDKEKKFELINHKYDVLIDKLMSIHQMNKSENNINVK